VDRRFLNFIVTRLAYLTVELASAERKLISPLLLSPWFYGHWHAVSRPQGDETLGFDGVASLEA
jgi:hypothetical protein